MGESSGQLFRPNDIPRPPEVVTQIIREATDPDVSPKRLADRVAVDPGFTSEVLRTVNSSLYSPRSPVKTITQAVMVLGGRALRNLATCFAVRDSIKSWRLRKADLEQFWEACLRRGVAARMLAEQLSMEDPTEAFTVSLLQDFGFGILMHTGRKTTKRWSQLYEMLPQERRVLEKKLFGTTHDAIVALVGERWGIPDALVKPIANHHCDPEDIPPTYHRETCIVQVADEIAAVFSSTKREIAIQRARELCCKHFRLSSEQVDNLLRKVSGHVETTAVELGFRVAKQPDYQEIVNGALQSLVDMNLSYEQLVTKLEKVIQEKDSLARELEKANKKLLQLANADALTKLANRRHFRAVFDRMLSAAVENCHPLTLIMADIDYFKKVNDTHGHAAGDAVLVACADAIRSAVREEDFCARIGGEEFAILLPNTTEEGGRIVGTRICTRIANLPISIGELSLRITVSLGGATAGAKGSSLANIEELMRAADEALYRSKARGRNQLNWVNFTEEIPSDQCP